MNNDKENELFYRNILFDSPIGYAYHKIILDDQGNPCDYQFLEVNETFGRLTGLDSNKIIGKKVTDVLPNISQDPAKWISVYGEVALLNIHKAFTSFSQPLKRWYNVDAFSPRKNYFITLFTDITDTKEQEIKYNQLYEQRQLMFYNHDASMLMIDSDTGRIIEANQSAIDFYGYTKAELLSKSVWDINTKSKEEVQLLLEEAEKKKRNFFTVTHRLKSGEIRYVDLYSTPIPNKEKKLLFSIIFDVTKREESLNMIRIAEQDLRNSQLLLKASLNSPKDIIILSLDKHYNYLYFNDTHKNVMKSAYNANVEIGKCIFDYMSPTDIPKARRNYSKALKGQAHVTRETYGDVIVKTYETFYNPIKDENDKIIGVSAYARDITEITDLNKRIEVEKLTAEKYFNIAGVMLLVLDTDGNIQDINEKGCSLLSLEKKDIIGKNWFENFIPDIARKEIKDVFTQVMRQKGIFNTLDYENPIVDSKGQKKDIFWHNTKFYDVDGNIKGVLCSGEDVTERNNALRKIVDNEKRFRSLFEKAPLGYQSLDENGCFLDVNEKWQEIFGYNKDEVIGESIENLLPDDVKSIFKNRFEMFKKTGSIHSEFPMKAKNGKMIEVAFDGNIVYDNHHGFMRTHCTINDITELKIINEKLKENEKKLSLFMSNVEEAIYGIDINENCTFINQSFTDLLGYKEDEVIGKNMHDLIHHSYEDGTKYPVKNCPMGKAFKRGERVKIDLDYLWKKNGEKIPVEFSGNPLFEDGKLIGAVVAFKDITERLKNMEELKLSSQKFHSVLDSASDILFTVDKSMNYTDAYGKSLERIKLNKDKFLEKNFNQIFGNEYWEVRKEKYQLAFKGVKSEHTWEYNFENDTIIYQTTISPLYNAKNEIIGAVGVSRDITEIHNHVKELEYVNNHDFLTDLYNRRYITKEIENCDKNRKYPYGLINIDINGLKTFNDIYGHNTGDIVLIKVANVLKSVFGNTSIVARSGDDDFLILVPNAKLNNLKDMIDKARQLVSKIIIQNITVSVAIGCYIKHDDSIGVESALKLAEDDMLKEKVLEKSSNKNRAIQAIFKTLTDKYEDERIHSEFVSSISVAIGKELNLSKDQLKLLETAATFHDIGKIAIPDHVLKKPGRLTDEEFNIIKSHTEIGYQILSSADKYSDLAKHALYHHEKWDGKGYPHGLKGEEIPLISRIIGIADAYEAMTSNRVYRKKLTNKEAIKEIVKYSGTQFDPDIARIFVGRVLKKQWDDYM